MWIISCILVCIFLGQIYCKPQITKLLPVQDPETLHQTTPVTPFDKLFEKVRATYDSIFHKSENVSNVERVIANNETNTALWILNRIWTPNEKPMVERTTIPSTTTEDWWSFDRNDNVKPQKRTWLEPLDQELDEPQADVDIVTPKTNSQLPMPIGKHLLQWFGSLMSLTYGAYLKLSRIIHS